MSSVTIERGGISALVVDRGRVGRRHEGIAWCGPADALAYTIANVLVLNDEAAAAIECAYGDMHVRFDDTRTFAITGADCAAELDGVRCPPWSVNRAERGQTLILHVPKRDVFSYLGIGGGIGVPDVLGSKTTDRSNRFGGFEGRALRKGDAVPLSASRLQVDESFAVVPPERRAKIRITTSPEFERFTAQRELFDVEWRVGPHADRMGYRLTGGRLEYGGPSIASHAVFPGIIQVPPSGEPIVLLADAHTTGGYPKAGMVIEADLRLVAQTRSGETLRFANATADEIARAAAARRAYVQAIAQRAREQVKR